MSALLNIQAIWLQFLLQSEGATCPFDDASIDESGLLKDYSLSKMALNLAESQHAVIRNMNHSKLFKANKIANVARCSPRAIFRIKKNPCCFSSTKVLPNGVGRPQSITPSMFDVLCKHLLEKP